ncbi:hypothetical protein TUBRATIS_007250 [Tubulinosema ratisbonensis]|uniref:Uncharacterized protein n=1 Tax=Tubulinosema ratisbonensis TaxID=291195 RepID=A0A437ANH0_9MICR|nr:hypothetical protein TUBRATIS_007250 [Tubulinosema ratisbonensis]
MPGIEKVDESFCKVLLIEFLKQTDVPPRKIGSRLGTRLSDDFLARTELCKADTAFELAIVSKRFFEEYFNYSPKVIGERVFMEDFFVNDNKTLELLAGLLEILLGFSSTGVVSIAVLEQKVFEITIITDS